ncbi:MAG: electron transfer flavoprotein subunit alpha/FixB family protein [Desulfobacteraceae bacterium]|nr:electron transfer flavoprotein subunit alpha/FixB family protein [Desulfobacteraceae bacterium]MBC2755884.1 electron transfer flavoprotein subunit alpha/FixB family protein [Desulfobacteraceae bacterium]
MSSVCIIAEHQNGKLKKSTLNAITFGKDAAEKLGAELCVVVIGHEISGVADELKKSGASKIIIADDACLENYTAEQWAHVAAEAAQKYDAMLVGMASGTTGKDMMPRVAVKLNAGMGSDIIEFDGTTFKRGMWAGNALATIEITTPVKVVTIQTTAFAAAEPVEGESVLEQLDISLPQTKTRFVEMRETVSERPDPTEAGVVITGGRGVNGAENFKIIERLADIFGGAVGATRAAVDAGWVPNDLQIGQTGKMVAPDLYVAAGLSGSIQHQAGMKNSKVIVAINKDEEAPIFQIADFGIVADLFKVIPEMSDLLEKEMS